MSKLTETQKYQLKLSTITLTSWDFRVGAMREELEEEKVDAILEGHRNLVQKVFPKMFGVK